MRTTITITSKGQTTLPSELRRKLQIGKTGGTLQIRFDERKRIAVLSRPVSIARVSQRFSRFVKHGTKPLSNVDDYYQKHRHLRLAKEDQ